MPALAFDYDGTLATEGRLAPDTEACLREVQRRGNRLVLVTGRILADLHRVCPSASRLFDRIVAENGPVLAAPGQAPRALGPRVPDALYDALRAQDVPVDRGEVILATLTAYEAQVERCIAQLHIDCARFRNREALMLLPTGTSKKSGLEAALAELGVEAKDAIGFGDAENDRELFAACGRKIAVGNAVPALKAIADVVLPAPNGEAIRAYLCERVLGRR
jgi:hydroxymethylpyrimidine pyrophosphatase-like HAD family hydrolase